MKRILALLIAAILLTACAPVYATEGSMSPTPPDGEMPEMPGGQPPEMPDGEVPGGTPPEMPNSQAPGNQPPAMQPEGGMGPGGQANQPEAYSAVHTVEEDAELTGSIASTGADENAIHIASGALTLTDASIDRSSADSTGGDSASFYGVGAAILATGGSATIDGVEIHTDAAGGAGVFAYGDGVVRISDSTITTLQDTSGGIHVAGGGTLYASNLTVTTEGASSAAIRSDRGSGVMVVDGGSYTASGAGSPAVYVTADITIRDAALTATGSEALCLEGLNSVRLYGCDLTGALPDLDQNDNSWTVILYQSMSGDAESGKGRFEMSGGTLTSLNGGLFYTTNTESEFVLSGVEIAAAEDSEYFLRCTGNQNARGWGPAGANGADCTFTAIRQAMTGDVLWDSISRLDLYLTQGSQLTGAVLDDESCAGEGGDGGCKLTIDADSSWIVTADSSVTELHCAGTITDAEGRAVSIVGTDGTVYVSGESALTVTASSYSADCDLTGAGSLTA